WGWGFYGQLGNGEAFPVLSAQSGSAVPVEVEDTSGSGTLTNVVSLASEGSNGTDTYCAVLNSGQVDCWGYGLQGELGNGGTSQDDHPVAVAGVGGVGTLSGVASLSAGTRSFCAVLTAGGVDCWGDQGNGQLGNGQVTGTTAVPTSVEGVGGSGSLGGVGSVV